MIRFAALVSCCLAVAVYCREFKIDYDQDRFVKDGKTFQVVSGSLHYFNVPYQLWEDRLKSLRDCGMNTVQTYIEWRTIEPLDSQFDFTGQNNITDFIVTAQRVGLLVNIRLGPYIDSEREMGGLPWWIMQADPNMTLRTNNPTFMMHVNNYWAHLSELINPLLYSKGGPVIMLQLENEYGSYPSCDYVYTETLKEYAYSLFGQDVVYYTTDGNSDGDLRCGKIAGVYPTVDFGVSSSVKDSFAVQRRHQLHGPLVNSEFYSGWLDIWGTPHQTVPTEAVVRSLDEMLSMNASVNMYMFHGGTNFGFDNGAELYSNQYKICPTTYDYDAPLTEAGDPTDKCFAIKNTVKKYVPVSDTLPVVKPKMALGNIVLKKTSGLKGLLGGLRTLSTDGPSKDPLTFEDLHNPYGLVAYETTIPYQPVSPALLKVTIRDRGYVFVDYHYQGILSREIDVNQLAILANKNSTLTILVENQGRVCFGSGIKDFKGILGSVTLGTQTLNEWNHLPIPDKSENFYFITPFINDYRRNQADYSDLRDTLGFGVYEATVTINQSSTPIILDTYLRFDGWNKGYVLVNGVNLGRYWPNTGPQITLYVPGVYLKYGDNKIIVVELEGAPENKTISFVNTPEINGPVAVQ